MNHLFHNHHIVMQVANSGATTFANGLAITAGGITLATGLQVKTVGVVAPTGDFVATAGTTSITNAATGAGVVVLDAFSSVAGASLTAAAVSGRVAAGITGANLMLLNKGNTALFQVWLMSLSMIISLSRTAS